jgi:hypothetical protein
MIRQFYVEGSSLLGFRRNTFFVRTLGVLSGTSGLSSYGNTDASSIDTDWLSHNSLECHAIGRSCILVFVNFITYTVTMVRLRTSKGESA